jgi:hypothetical protein
MFFTKNDWGLVVAVVHAEQGGPVILAELPIVWHVLDRIVREIERLESLGVRWTLSLAEARRHEVTGVTWCQEDWEP